VSSILAFLESDPSRPTFQSNDRAEIARILRDLGVRFEAWDASVELAPGAGDVEILAAYQRDVERIRREGPYASVDVVRILPPDGSDPSWVERVKTAREKFRDEHTHAEAEVRFFVEGRGVFYLRAAGRVTAVVCERGDWIALPAGIRHWFDMGPAPRFCAIRFFGTPDGWVASFTGDPIARAFPDFDAAVGAAS
jgi:1,2-dihydroxy-3-keto-5-methylthiopentene dioxygenase